MDTLFTSVDKEANYSTKIDIDQLYERKQKSDLTKLDLYNKLLNRIHIKIKTISRIHNNQQWCWFCIPEVMIGSPKYNQLECISYIIEKLYDNGFNVKYINPNCLLISWANWVQGYVRNEKKKKTGIVVDEYGNQLEENNDKEELNNFFNNKQKLGENKGQENKSEQKNKNYKPINSYKPIGNFTF